MKFYFVIKKVLLIHDFEGSTSGNFLPWLEKRLSNAGYKVINKKLPNPEHPDFKKVMQFLHEQTVNFTDSDIIVGHSLGAYFALKLTEEKRFGGLYLIAPAIGNLPYAKYRKNWKGSDINALEKTISNGFDLNKVQTDKKSRFFRQMTLGFQ